tara:strand:+ start:1022 stop:1525 length:504 start_codon:yes stop_codon:yes gene_type:complete
MLFKNKQINSAFMILVVSISIVSCGYTMRGSINLPPTVKEVSVFSENYSTLVNAINESLLNLGINTTASNNKKLYRIIITEENFNRRQLTMSITGRVNEYELIYNTVYQINLPNDEVLYDSITLYRDYSFDENNVMGNSDRENQIKDEMISTAATLIFNKLAATVRQ